MVPKFIMLIGVPGSGKSTKAKELADEYNALIFSSDAYRVKLCGNESDQTKNDAVFKLLYADLKKALESGSSCILDATNISFKSRSRTLEYFSKVKCERIAYVINTPVEQCIIQDKNRERVVGESVLQSYFARFDFPQRFEGFDDIKLANYHAFSRREYEIAVMQMHTFDQKNPHHIYSLGMHCFLTAYKFDDDDERKEAAYLHDIGKLYTQRIDDNSIAHYYGHANYGTYVLACSSLLDSGTENVEEVLFYVNEHMHIRDILQSERAIAKYKKLWGEDRFNKLVEFMEADNKASGIS